MKAGLVLTDSGPVAVSFVAFRAGVDARLGVLNAAGGVNGRKIVYSWADDASSPEQNSTVTRQLIEREQVFGLIESSVVASGGADYLDKNGIPVIGQAIDDSWGKHQNMFSASYVVASGPSVSTFGEFVRSQGGTRAVLMESLSSESAQRYRQQVTDSLQSAGVTIGLQVDVATEVTDPAAVVERMKAAHIDTIAGGVTPDILAKIIPAVRAAGIPMKVILAPTGYDPVLLQQIGPLLAGTTIYLSPVPYELNTPAHQTLLAAMSEYAPQIQPPRQQIALEGWIAADMFIRGLQAAGSCPTRESFIRGLRGVHSYDADGLLPRPVDFATNLGQLSACYEFVRISDDGRSFVPLQPPLRCGNRLG